MAKPTVSVIVPTFDRARYLPECLESLLVQTFPASEIIVVNDGSTDDTAQALRPYLRRITYVEKENEGKSTALNLVMPAVRSDYVWIFDDDDVALPDALETHLRALAGDPEAGFSYSSYCEGIVGADGRLSKGPLYPLPAAERDDLFPRLLEGCFIAHPAIVVRSRCYREVGPFDSRLMRSQDYDMLLRLSRRFKGIRMGMPTCILRTHRGFRGSSVERFSPERRPLEWLKYDKIIFRRLYEELAPSEYLAGGRKNEPLTETRKRSALLQRMSVMARKGLWPLAARDLDLVARDHGLARPLSPCEGQACRNAMANGFAVEGMLSDGSFVPAVRRLCRQPAGSQMRYEFSRGLYYHAVRVFRRRSYALALGVLVSIVQILGLPGTVEAIKFKLKLPSEVQ